jgi:glycosyltransferase involved in cell wall biosynthesis
MKIVVSIVLSCYNSEKTLYQCLNSINNQIFPFEYELIFINDGSIDNSLDIFNKFPFNNFIKTIIISRSNKGFVYSLNEGINLASSNLIARIDSDDYWDTNHLYNIYTVISNDMDLVLVGTQANIVDFKNDIIGIYNLPISDIDIKKYFIKSNPFIHSSVIFRKDIFIKSGQYQFNIKYNTGSNCDYLLWIKMSYYGKCKNLLKNDIYYRYLKNSMSRNLDIKTHYKIRLQYSYIYFLQNKKYFFYFLFCSSYFLYKIIFYSVKRYLYLLSYFTYFLTINFLNLWELLLLKAWNTEVFLII